MNDKEIEISAKEIALIFRRCPTEKRGELLEKISQILRDGEQGFTASIFTKAAIAYEQAYEHVSLFKSAE